MLPITKVDSRLDGLTADDRTRIAASNSISKAVYQMYDAEAMHGLPIGVQVVGQKLEEEKVLEGMKLIEGLLRDKGLAYEPIEI